MAASDNPVADLFLAPIPAGLAYRTTLAGLEEVLSSGRIPVTEARDFETSEFAVVHDLAADYLRSIPADDAAVGYAKESARRMIAKAFQPETQASNLAVCAAAFWEDEYPCFSEAVEAEAEAEVDRGDVPHFVSVVFDLTGLRQADQSIAAGQPGGLSGWSLSPCVYDIGQKGQLVQSVLDRLIAEVAQLYRGVQDQWRSKVDYRLWATVRRQSNLVFDLPTYGENVQNEFHRQRRAAAGKAKSELLRLTGIFRDPAFIESREWRLLISSAVSPYAKDGGRDLQARAGEPTTEQGARPDLTVDLRDPDGRLAVTRVWAKPGSFQQTRSILERYGCASLLVEWPG